MKIQEIYAPDARSCDPEIDVGKAGAMMAESCCGILPVVDADARVVGIVTDRDLCMALCSLDKLPHEVMVRQVMSRPVHTCRLEDTILVALRKMGKHKVHRLPVVNDKNQLQGIVSIDDFLLLTGHGKTGKELPGEGILATLRDIVTLYDKKIRATVAKQDDAGGLPPVIAYCLMPIACL